MTPIRVLWLVWIASWGAWCFADEGSDAERRNETIFLASNMAILASYTRRDLAERVDRLELKQDTDARFSARARDLLRAQVAAMSRRYWIDSPDGESHPGKFPPHPDDEAKP